MYSAPIVFLCAILIGKIASVVVAGNVASLAYRHQDSERLESAVEWLEAVNVVEPGRTHFAAGSLAVLQGRLDVADREFSASLAHTSRAESCPGRVNLELVRETRGDRAAARLEDGAALAFYRSARDVVEQAGPGCFLGNVDDDMTRRAIRSGALARLDTKIAAAQTVPLPAPPLSSPTQPLPAGPSPAESPVQDVRRLNPGTGTPLDRLQQILADAAVQANQRPN